MVYKRKCFKGNGRNTISRFNGIFISVMLIEELVINVIVFHISLEDNMWPCEVIQGWAAISSGFNHVSAEIFTVNIGCRSVED